VERDVVVHAVEGLPAGRLHYHPIAVALVALPVAETDDLEVGRIRELVHKLIDELIETILTLFEVDSVEVERVVQEGDVLELHEHLEQDDLEDLRIREAFGWVKHHAVVLEPLLQPLDQLHDGLVIRDDHAHDVVLLLVVPGHAFLGIQVDDVDLESLLVVEQHQSWHLGAVQEGDYFLLRTVETEHARVDGGDGHEGHEVDVGVLGLCAVAEGAVQLHVALHLVPELLHALLRLPQRVLLVFPEIFLFQG